MLRLNVGLEGGDNLQRALDDLAKLSKEPSQVKVGIPDGALRYPEGVALLLVAAVQEFGSTDGRIPERSYLRATVVKEAEKFRKFWRSDHARDLLMGEGNADLILNLLGQLAQAEVQKTIIKIKEPPNAPATIAAKGSSNPLVDTGLLRQSIRYVVDD